MDTIASDTSAILKQHLIDPESCVRCGNCEDICPEKAITLGARNYVIDAAKRTHCGTCLDPCPTQGNRVRSCNPARNRRLLGLVKNA